jgi:hypothetical protein
VRGAKTHFEQIPVKVVERIAKPFSWRRSDSDRKSQGYELNDDRVRVVPDKTKGAIHDRLKRPSCTRVVRGEQEFSRYILSLVGLICASGLCLLNTGLSRDPKRSHDAPQPSCRCDPN